VVESGWIKDRRRWSRECCDLGETLAMATYSVNERAMARGRRAGQAARWRLPEPQAW